MSDSVDVVELVSDDYHDLSMTVAGMASTDAGYKTLMQKRAELGVRLDRLIDESFKDDTKRFVDANADLVTVNKAAQSALQGLQNMKDTIDAVTSLINAVDGFIKTAFPLPG